MNCYGGTEPRRRSLRRRTSEFVSKARHQRNSGDRGFTLIELMVVVTILPLIVGGIAIALLATFRIQSGVSNRLSGSQDAQAVAASFVHDVQSASIITTDATSSPQCGAGAGSQVLGLMWGVRPQTLGGVANSTAETAVSYRLVANGTLGGTTTHGLQRLVCSIASTGVTPTLLSTQTISLNANSDLTAQVTGQSCGSTNFCTSPLVPSVASVTYASGNGSYIDYKAANNFVVGQLVTISNLGITSGSALNLSSVMVATDDGTQFTVTNPTVGVSSGTGSATGASVTGGWILTTGINRVVLPIVEAANLAGNTNNANYVYALTAAPRNVIDSTSGTSFPTVPTLTLLGSGSSNINCPGGAASITINGGLGLNSTSSPVSSHNNVQATFVQAVASSATNVTATSGTITYNNPPFIDPYQNLAAPNTSGLTEYPSTVTTVSGPGIYDGNVSISGTLASGVYEFKSGYTIKSTVDGTAGVLFYVIGGQIDMGGNAQINLNPVQTPPAPNLVIWQVAGDTNPIFLNGNSLSDINGIIYAPSALVQPVGGTTVNVGGILASSLYCNGNVTYNIG